jgi:hypothetical protein
MSMNFNDIDWMGLSLGIAGQTVFLTVALWIMLKIQGFDRNVFGLIGAAALASALDRIPYVGIEISLVVLLLCITKLIHARTFTDAIFTVGISYAITFAFNMFVITMLMADLRPSAKVRARIAEAIAAARAAAQTNEPAGTNAAPAKVEPTTAAVAAPQIPATTNAAAPVPAPDLVVDTNRLNSVRLAGDIFKQFFVKGVSQGATISIAMISNGTKNYDLAAGDTIQLPTSDGKFVAVKCESVAEGRVLISVEGVQTTLLRR